MKLRMPLSVLLLQLWREVSSITYFTPVLIKPLHFTVPGPPTNPIAMPSVSICNEVLFSWNLPPEDEQNGTIQLTWVTHFC